LGFLSILGESARKSYRESHHLQHWEINISRTSNDDIFCLFEDSQQNEAMQTIFTRSAPGKMYFAFLQSRFPSPLQAPPVVLLRVKYYNRNSPVYNEIFKDFNMVARGLNRPITRQAFNDCLLWEKVNTPFVPFTSK
jgi:hypothetical protein